MQLLKNPWKLIGFLLGIGLFAFLINRPLLQGLDFGPDGKMSRAETPNWLEPRFGTAAKPGLDKDLDGFLTPAELLPLQKSISRTAAVAALMAMWWVTVAIPLPVTSLLPLILFPALRIMDAEPTATRYMNSTIFLFLGGFILALAMERWNLHRRIALNILNLMGDKPVFLSLGFMLSTGFISMWISNTACAMMMAPIGLSIVTLVEEASANLTPREQKKAKNFSAVIMLGIAYASTIGGTATLIGTTTNLAFHRLFKQSFPLAPEVTFAKWFLLVFPFALVFLLIAWFLMAFVLQRLPKESAVGGRGIVKQHLKGLGRMQFPEGAVLFMFLLAIFLWIFRVDMDLGSFTIRGWAGWFPALGLSIYDKNGEMKAFVEDGTVAVVIAVLLFLIPTGRKEAPFVMEWKATERLPWGIVLLFGGGFALAAAFNDSGLSAWVGSYFAALEHQKPVAIVAGTGALMTGLTQLTSNVAAAETAIPILAAIAREASLNPLLLIIPATIAASCDFMLPVGTPPNAIIFATGKVSMARMIYNGILLNIIGCALLVVTMTVLGEWALQTDLSKMPEGWVEPAEEGAKEPGTAAATTGAIPALPNASPSAEPAGAATKPAAAPPTPAPEAAPTPSASIPATTSIPLMAAGPTSAPPTSPAPALPEATPSAAAAATPAAPAIPQETPQ